MRSDTDNCEGHILDEQRPAKNCRIARKAPSPIVVADHSHLRVIPLILQSKTAAAKDFRTQTGKKVPTDLVACALLRHVPVPYRHFAYAKRNIGNKVFEDIMALAKGLEDRLRERRLRIACIACAGRLPPARYLPVAQPMGIAPAQHAT